MLTALTSADEESILDLVACRTELRLTADDAWHYDKVRSIRSGAIGWCEGYTGKALGLRSFEWRQNHFERFIRLPIGPVTAVSAISYLNGSGVETQLDPSAWYVGLNSVSAAPDTVWPYSNGAPGAVRITFSAGYASPDDIPPYLLTAVKLAMAAMFEDFANPDMTGAIRCANQSRRVI